MPCHPDCEWPLLRKKMQELLDEQSVQLAADILCKFWFPPDEATHIHFNELTVELIPFQGSITDFTVIVCGNRSTAISKREWGNRSRTLEAATFLLKS
jgi:hypothetical protein